MADALVIDSIAAYGTAISVPCQKGGEGSPRLVGEETPSSSGSLRSSVLTEKRVWGATSTVLTTTVKDSIKARIAGRRQVYCSGELFANVDTLCSIELMGCDMVEGTNQWVMQFTIREV